MAHVDPSARTRLDARTAEVLDQPVVAAARVERGPHPMLLALVVSAVSVVSVQAFEVDWAEIAIGAVALGLISMVLEAAFGRQRIVARTGNEVLVLRTGWLWYVTNRPTSRIVQRIDADGVLRLGDSVAGYRRFSVGDTRFWVSDRSAQDVERLLDGWRPASGTQLP